MARVEDAIIKNLQVFVAFARKRLGDHHLAEDVVQESLVNALAADRHPESEEETTTWFYRILRRSIIDVYRKQGARSRALERFEKELPETPGDDDEQELCQCFRRLLPMVPEQYRRLLEEVDLKGQEPDEVAAKLGVTRNNLTVRLHRARKHLRKVLSQNCRACSTHGCLDCTCEESNADNLSKVANGPLGPSNPRNKTIR
jgi:RNA polymerase sigma-70 factor (ECF subfamily)